ncbi:TIGR02450 family Trp-rich protein [Nevskia sp.]|uniref:TIGR02450 family Trp-rich protein n=1 Tax=Nevskia sp. TaxID=1929292 RepID=UPI0025F970F7|nr:TIGR02450 family Trp-rich protein [Nevskia sp.]
MNTPLNPKQLPLSKWTAVKPVDKEKHFIVVKLIEAEPPGAPVIDIELQAVHSGRVQVLPWRALSDPTAWKRGWV